MISWNVLWHTTYGNVLFIAGIVLILAGFLIVWFKLGRKLEQQLKIPDRVIGALGLILCFLTAYFLSTQSPHWIGRYGEIQGLYLFKTNTPSITVIYKKHRKRGPKSYGAVNVAQKTGKTLGQMDIGFGIKAWHTAEGRFLIVNDPKRRMIYDLSSFKPLVDIHDAIQTRVHGKSYKVTMVGDAAIEVLTQDGKEHVFPYQELVKKAQQGPTYNTHLTPESQCKLSTRAPYHYKKHLGDKLRVLKLTGCGVSGTLFMHRSTAFGPSNIMLSWQDSAPKDPNKVNWTIDITKQFGEAPNIDIFPITQQGKTMRFLILKGRYGLFELTVNDGTITHSVNLL